MSGSPDSFEDAASTVARLVERAVGEAVTGEPLVAVAFSGGLDSSIVVACAKRNVRVVACTASSVGARDASRARVAAKALGVELVATELTEENVASALATIRLPFEPTLMDRSLWCLYSIVSGSASRCGARVLLLGQLADELFGGYAKYAEALRVGGEHAARKMMDGDLREYANRGRIRDLGACGRLVQPRLPFEHSALVGYAGSLPVSFKIRGGIRKAVLRKAALALGVPEGLAEADKKAAQYSSGIQRLVAGLRF